MQFQGVVREMANAETGRCEWPKIVMQGYLKKLKTMKKKYFVLKAETPENAARLEYYDSEKKFKSNCQPKRVIPLNSCFNITRRLDTRQKHVIALYTKEECTCLVLDNEEDLADWLHALHALLHGESANEKPHPRQHVWQVNVQKKGLGASGKILGLYNLCLTDKTLSLVKIRHNLTPLPPDMRATDTIEFSLMSIRRCGDSECFFYMEVGRSSVTGAGELWMLTEDPNIAQSMHTTILHAMSNNKSIKEELSARTRSSSVNEASKPISLTRRQTHSGVKSHGMSPSSESAFCGSHMCVGSCIAQCGAESAAYCAPTLDEDKTPLSTVGNDEEAASEQEPSAAVAVGSPLARNVTDENHALTVTVAHERTRSLPLTGEENTDVLTNLNGRCLLEAISRHQESINARLGMPNGSHHPPNGVHHHKIHHSGGGGGRRASTGCRFVKWSPSRCTIAGVTQGVRERCDSLPSRANFIPSNFILGSTGVRPTSNSISGHQISRPLGSILRPHSIHTHNVSQSPPVMMNTPLSPHTDSAGSSLSTDETDGMMHHSLTEDIPHMITRLLNSRTPDERMIPEEVETFGMWQPEKSLIEKLEKTILNHSDSLKENIPRKTSLTSFLDMSSPVSIHASSLSDSGGYMPMSPAGAEPVSKMIHSRTGGINSASHSRTSSLADDAMHLDNHPPAAPTSDDGYVDMESRKEHASQHTMSPAGSVCSVTSGTPSNDLRFSEFHLEKVVSYFSPSEEEENEDNRPTRAYSVGSRPDRVPKVIARPETHTSIHTSADTASSRTRAFSVGSRSKSHKDSRLLNHGTPPHHNLHHLIMTNHGSNKSSSAPILPGGHHHVGTPSRHTYGSSHGSAEPLDDLMELDFTKRTDSSSSIEQRHNKSKTNTSNIPHSTSRSSQLSLGVPVSSVQTSVPSRRNDEGYMDMSPVSSGTIGYVEMKPPELSGSATKLASDSVRKTSISKSPSDSIAEVIKASDSSNSFTQQPSMPEGYVEMSWNGKIPSRTRISSLPIAINPSITKDITQVASSASPIFSMTSLLKNESGGLFENKSQECVQKISPGVLPIVPIATSPVSSLRRNSKKHLRRNSKEFPVCLNTHSQSTFPFALNSPGSPMKPLLPRSDSTPNRKCSVDASSGTVKLSSSEEDTVNSSFTSIEKTICNSLNECSDYMDMTPGRLSTVKEITEPLSNKSGVDKDTKQMLNNATKVSSSNQSVNVTPDSCDYIILNPNATVNTNKTKNHWFKTQRSVDDSVSYSSMKNKPPNGNQSANASKGQNNGRKVSMPSFTILGMKNADTNSKENQGILSSNPLANKTLTSNPLSKSNTNVTNFNQSQQTVKKPVVVLSQPQQPITANFKPITASEVSEFRNTKSGSPKPIESVLNRQLAGALYDNKSKCGSSNNDCFENRTNSLNKCKKVNSNSSSRPPSVTSELSSGGTVRSRPSSVSSEISGTPTNSRPASVTSEREGGGQISSITEGRRLHYASLEHDVPSERSPRPPVTPIATHPPNFTYAQIDFVKSEELKNSKNLSTKSKN